MPGSPTISVLIPCFNAAPFIEETLRSVVDQLGPDDEVVVQDGGSTDGTVDLFRRAAERDGRILVVSEPDAGQSDALQRALARARNDFVLWLNADDLVLPGAVEAVRAAASDPAVDVVWGGHRYIAADGAVIEDFAPERFDHALFMRRGCYVFSGSTAIRRRRLIEIGGIDRALHYCMDLDLMLRLDEQVPGSAFRRVDETIGALRWHDASKSGSTARPFLREGWIVRGRHLRSRIDHVRRVEALAVLGVAHLTVGIRHTPLYRKLRRRVISPLSSIKTSAPRALADA